MLLHPFRGNEDVWVCVAALFDWSRHVLDFQVWGAVKKRNYEITRVTKLR
jgi:hypothetical protein